jgi:hypothetical protein
MRSEWRANISETDLTSSNGISLGGGTRVFPEFSDQFLEEDFLKKAPGDV